MGLVCLASPCVLRNEWTFGGNGIGQCQCVHIFLWCCLCLRTQQGTENPNYYEYEQSANLLCILTT